MPKVVHFDRYEVDLSAGRLYKHGVRINLREKSFQVLAALLEHPGELVTREDLRRQLWPEEVFVDFDNNLNTAIARLREALCDSADHPRFIETLPKRGYRFLEHVLQPPRSPGKSRTTRVRLVVLPFLNLSGDPSQEYFSDAITDEIITDLAGPVPERLAVIARTTAMHYKGSHKDVSRIGRELQVDDAVEGGVHRTEDQLAVNVQLIQTGDQTQLFAQKYSAPMPDMFGLHSRVAQDIIRHVPPIADAMRDGLTLREDIRRKPTENLAAYNEYIKGRYEMWSMTAEGTARAKRHFEAALARDPDFAPACNSLAEVYWYMGFWGYAPCKETDLLGRSYALRAIAIDSRSADTHVLLSFFPQRRNGHDEIDYYNWTEILKHLVHARELDPESRAVRVRYAAIQAMFGRIEEAVAELELALELDPLSFHVRSWLAIVLYLGRQYDRALEQVLRTLDLQPEHFVSYFQLGHVYLAMHRFEESAAALRKGVEISHELPPMLGVFGLSLGLGGKKPEAQVVLDRLRALARQQYVSPTSFAWVHLGLGDIDEAFLWMERAVDAPDRLIEPIRGYPFLDPLRADPRFAALLRKMNLESAPNEPSLEGPEFRRTL
jgi:TolB-like protein/tetratricopeptide (TPR) repeat protein